MRSGACGVGEPMKILLHYKDEISEATKMALASESLHLRTNMPHHRPPPLMLDIIHCPVNGPHDYGDSLMKAWELGETFINLEQDVAPWPGALSQMWSCASWWCAMPLIVHGAV